MPLGSGQVVKKFQGGWWIYHNGRLVPVVSYGDTSRARIIYGYEIWVDDSTDNPVLSLLIKLYVKHTLFFFSGA